MNNIANKITLQIRRRRTNTLMYFRHVFHGGDRRLAKPFTRLASPSNTKTSHKSFTCPAAHDRTMLKALRECRPLLQPSSCKVLSERRGWPGGSRRHQDRKRVDLVITFKPSVVCWRDINPLSPDHHQSRRRQSRVSDTRTAGKGLKIDELARNGGEM